jgi:hypothetical protein
MGSMKKQKTALQICFIILFTASLLLFWLVPFLGQKETSETENRSLARLPAFSADAFLAGTYQENLEAAAGDQLLFSEEIRSFVKGLQASVLAFEQDLLRRLDPSLRDGYTQIAEGYYAYRGDEHRIVEKPRDYEESAAEVAAFARPFNELEGVRRYLYFIGNSRVIDFDHPENDGRIYEWIRSFFTLDGASCFASDGYEDYCRWFYQTDHHWNDQGFYRGYQEILKLLKPDDAPAGPGERLETDAVFNGSYARVTKSLRADEHFVVRSFDLPKYAVTLNGKRGTYGKLKSYLSGRFSSEPLTNHYANCYGGDYGEIVYDFSTEDRGRLLLVASSYSNPINALIASHFDRTYVIDLRYYEAYAGHVFDPSAYVKEHSIDTVLVLGDIRLFLPGTETEGGGD